MGKDGLDCLCWIYVLVGMYEMLFVYLVCWLLENVVNLLFVSCIVDLVVVIVDFVVDLVELVGVMFVFGVMYLVIVLFVDFYLDWCNLVGIDFVDEDVLVVLG